MSVSEHKASCTNRATQTVLAAMSLFGAFMLLACLLRYSAYGIDFTDESFYLVRISNPFIYDGSATHFDFIYHPLYELLDKSTVALRRANILVTLALAVSMIYIFLISVAPDTKRNLIPGAVAAGLATSSLTLFDSWLLTPSYNSLALQSLLVAVTGLLLAQRTANRASIVGWLFIGIGGWLAFMAKPSTALGLAVGVLAYLGLSRKLSPRLLSMSIACTALLLWLSGLLIAGSLTAFVERILRGLEFGKYLGGGHTFSQMLRIDDFMLSERTQQAFWLVFVTLLVAIAGLLKRSGKLAWLAMTVSATFFVLSMLFITGQIHWGVDLGDFQGLIFFGAVLAVALTALVLGRTDGLKTSLTPQWALAALFLVMPHIYALGTNGNYWRTGTAAAIFWLLGSVVFLAPLARKHASWAAALPLALVAQTVTALLLQTGFEKPYRQPQPLRLNASTVEIDPSGRALVVSGDYADYISSALEGAQKGGFEPTTPMIDLSGQSPGILYAMGAESIGQAWTIGGYSGSLDLAIASLARVSCRKIAFAWLLVEPGGPRSIPITLMHNFGARFPDGYRLVAIWQTAEGAGGYPERRTQELYKPVDPDATLKACQSLRTSPKM